MNLTQPLDVGAVRESYPRETRSMGAGEIERLLGILERAMRSAYGVARTDAAADSVMHHAMLAAWPGFLIQLRQVAAETAGADSYQVTYNRADAIDLVFPSFIAAMLAGVADDTGAARTPSTTQLVR